MRLLTFEWSHITERPGEHSETLMSGPGWTVTKLCVARLLGPGVFSPVRRAGCSRPLRRGRCQSKGAPGVLWSGGGAIVGPRHPPSLRGAGVAWRLLVVLFCLASAGSDDRPQVATSLDA